MRSLLVDTHCHLDFRAFDKDRDAVIERARQAGIIKMLNPGVDLETSRRAIALAEQYAEVYAAVGVHPNDGKTWRAGTLIELHQLTQHPKVVAIGEIGLDYYREWTSPPLQREILEQQLTLAAEVQKPVIIHLRCKSNQDITAVIDLLEILSKWWYTLVTEKSNLNEHPGVFHSFGETEETAKQALEFNFMIGINGPVTYRNAQRTQKIVAGLPVNRILLETDAPFLTPQPRRGQRNEPEYVRMVAQKISELQNQTLEEVSERTTDNAERLFHW